MKRVALLALLTLAAATGASASSTQALHGDGVTLSLPAGWHGLVGPGGVQAADFPLPPRARNSASLVRVRRGQVHLIVWNGGPWVDYLPHRATRRPLVFRRGDVSGPFEGFPSDHAFALRTARLGGESLEVLADLGPKPSPPSALRKANAVLATLRVLPPRVLRPQNGRLASDGVSVRFSHGWSGRIEIPAGRYGARLVLRAARGRVHVELLELPGAPGGSHHDLPVALSSKHVLHRDSLVVGSRVFSNGGRSFELSATVPAAGDLQEVNRFLSTLEITPRPWTFGSCDLSLRLPGTWRAAVRPRGGCYPVLELRGPGVLVVLTELRPGERAGGRILRRAGRRFHVAIRPASARESADAVLATLRAKPRSCVFHSCAPQP